MRTLHSFYYQPVVPSILSYYILVMPSINDVRQFCFSLSAQDTRPFYPVKLLTWFDIRVLVCI